VKVEAGDNGTGTTLSTVDTQYAPCACSPLGKMSQVSIPYKLGEAVVWTKYQYDASGRTTRVTAPDGVSVTVDPGTNRITTAGYVYDVNGNVTQTPDGMTYAYDVANRMVSNNAVYNPKNQRVSDGAYLYYYGVGGELLGKYQPIWGSTTTVNGVVYTTPRRAARAALRQNLPLPAWQDSRLSDHRHVARNLLGGEIEVQLYGIGHLYT
jgi:hypothetical protein